MALKSSVERAQRAAGGFTYAKKNIVIQYGDKEQPEAYLLDLIRRDLVARGIKDGEIQELDVYIKPEEGAVYYVLNKELPGQVAF